MCCVSVRRGGGGERQRAATTGGGPPLAGHRPRLLRLGGLLHRRGHQLPRLRGDHRRAIRHGAACGCRLAHVSGVQHINIHHYYIIIVGLHQVGYIRLTCDLD